MKEGLVVPTPVFPESMDTWREMFRVFDSSQALLAKDLDPDDTQIEIVPRDPSRGPDVWGENGFVSINGEIIYYDSLEYDDYSPKYPISPLTHQGPTQSYRLSQCRRELVTEVISAPVLGGEVGIGSPDIVVLDALTNEPEYLDPATISRLYLKPPYSLMGKIRVGDQWYSFVCRGQGGSLHSGFDIDPHLSGLTAATLSKKGITLYGSAPVGLMEIRYLCNPIRDEPIVVGSLDLYLEGTQILKSDQIVSPLLNSIQISHREGSLILHWNTDKRQVIQPEFKLSRVIRLKDCLRSEREKRSHHRKGSLVGGFVVAEHHNNLVKGVINLEKWLNYLDDHLKSLEGIQIERNQECPNGTVSVEVLSPETRNSGPVVRFTLSSPSSSGNRIFFGDGTSEDNVGSVVHSYPRGSQFSPAAYFYNDQCEEYSTLSGSWATDQAFIPPVGLPTIPELGISPFEINLGELSVQIPDITVEAGVSPTLAEIDIPDVIRIDPSIIRISGPEIPTIIGFSQVNLPTWINLNYTGPTMIYFDPRVNLPTQISIVGMTIPTIISLRMLPIPTIITLTGMSIPSQISISISIAVDTSAISGNCFKLVPCTV